MGGHDPPFLQTVLKCGSSIHDSEHSCGKEKKKINQQVNVIIEKMGCWNGIKKKKKSRNLIYI